MCGQPAERSCIAIRLRVGCTNLTVISMGLPVCHAPALTLLAPYLRGWDRRAAATADRYLVNSHAVQDRVADLYGLRADVIPPPVDVRHEGEVEPVAGLEPGFFLCVSRMLPYKNVGAITAAFAHLPDQQLVVVGSGPLYDEVVASSPKNVTVLSRMSDPNLKWLYESSIGLVAASYEDFGLTPVEAASFGKPTAALRWGGFLDTIVEGRTGVFFEEPTPLLIAQAVERIAAGSWDPDTLISHAEQFSLERFVERMRAVVVEEQQAA